MSLLACRINGADNMQLAVTDRACQYGDGVFETLAVRGSKVEFLDAHLRRLGEGARRLGIPVPDPALWRADIRALLDGHQQGVLKLILSRGSGGRGYLVPAEPRVSRIVMFYPWPDHPPEYTREGVQLRWCHTRLAIQPQLAGIKHLNRLEQILARREWTDPAVQEGLMQDTRERVIEGTMSNLFLLKGDTLHTPDLSDCGVRGIMRQQVIDLASQSGIAVQCANYSRQEVDTADGLFLTNSIIGLWPVRQLEHVHFRPNPLLRQLQEQLDALRWQHAESDF